MPKRVFSRYMVEFDKEEIDALLKAAEILNKNNIDPDKSVRQNWGSGFVDELELISRQIYDLVEFGYIRKDV